MEISKQDRIRALRAEVKKDPGSDSFGELAMLLCPQPEQRAEAREICFAGLKRNPTHRIGRLALARLFYLDDMFEFSVRELLELKRVTSGKIESLDRLIASFGALAAQFQHGGMPESARGAGTPGVAEPPTPEQAEAVVAEIDLDVDFLEMAEEVNEKS